MTYEEIYSMISDIGIPCAYYQFPDDSGQQPPFICFYYPRSDDFEADDKNYQCINELTIELYTDTKDFDLEDAVKAALEAKGLVWSWDETEIESERMHMTTFYTEVIINA